MSLWHVCDQLSYYALIRMFEKSLFQNEEYCYTSFITSFGNPLRIGCIVHLCNGPPIVGFHWSVVHNDVPLKSNFPCQQSQPRVKYGIQDYILHKGHYNFYRCGFSSGLPFVLVVFLWIMWSLVREGQNLIPHVKEVICNEMWLVILKLILKAWSNTFAFTYAFCWCH